MTRKQAFKPIFPGFYARYLCRRMGHFEAWGNKYNCVRCGIWLVPEDKRQWANPDAGKGE